VSGKDFQEIKSAIAGLQKGELIIKDHTMAALGLGGKPYKKIKRVCHKSVTHPFLFFAFSQIRNL